MKSMQLSYPFNTKNDFLSKLSNIYKVDNIKCVDSLLTEMNRKIEPLIIAL